MSVTAAHIDSARREKYMSVTAAHIDSARREK
jgi:hypothetical protein